MNSSQRPNFRQVNVAAVTATFMSQVYFWMMAGLVLSGRVAYTLASEPQRVTNLVNNKFLFFGIFILQFGAVIIINANKPLSACYYFFISWLFDLVRYHCFYPLPSL